MKLPDTKTPKQKIMTNMFQMAIEPLADNGLSDFDTFPATLFVAIPNGSEKPDLIVINVSDAFTPQNQSIKADLLRDVLKKCNAMCYVLISEAWALELDIAKPYYVGGSLTNHDKRISILMATGETDDGDALFSSYVIDENNDRHVDLENPRMLELRDGNDTSPPHMQGMLVNLLGEERTQGNQSLH